MKPSNSLFNKIQQSKIVRPGSWKVDCEVFVDIPWDENHQFPLLFDQGILQWYQSSFLPSCCERKMAFDKSTIDLMNNLQALMNDLETKQGFLRMFGKKKKLSQPTYYQGKAFIQKHKVRKNKMRRQGLCLICKGT